MRNLSRLHRIASIMSGTALLLLLAGISSACASATETAPATAPASAPATAPAPPVSTATEEITMEDGWILVWSDEFDGPANSEVNRDHWLYDIGTGYVCSGCPAQWGTGEVETMTDSTQNVYLDGNGRLVIKPIRDAAGKWTSGRIETQRTDFRPPENGILAVEASIQQPDVSGSAAAGYWPAFWMLGAPFRGNYLNWPSVGEIDIMEDINGLSSVFGVLHCGTNPGGPCNESTGLGSGQQPCPGCQTSFHTYRVELDWSVSPRQIRWYLDGKQFFSVDESAVDATTWANATDHGWFIILNVAMGGGFPNAFGGGPTPATQSGVPMLVDYVRVMEQPAQAVYLPVIRARAGIAASH